VSDTFNPKMKFDSAEKLGNFIKQEYKNEAVEKAISNMDKPITRIDPVKNQITLEIMLNELSDDTPQKRKYKSVLLYRSRLSTSLTLKGVRYTRQEVTAYLAREFDCDFDEMEILESDAFRFAAKEIDRKSSSRGELIL